MRAKTAVEKGLVPYSLQTLYKWHSAKKYPALVFKTAGRLMVDVSEFQKMALRSRDEHVKTAAAVRAVAHD